MTGFPEPLMGTPKLAITIDFLVDAVVIKLDGDMDLDAEAAMKAAVARGLARAGPATALLVDVAGVSFADSSGLRSLMLARQAALDRGVNFTLRAPTKGVVRKRLTLAGLAKVFGYH
jgi:anti-anti-sigma factor